MINSVAATRTTTFKIGRLVQIGDTEHVGRIFKIDADARCSVDILGEVGNSWGKMNDDTNSFTPGCLRLVGPDMPHRSQIDDLNRDLTKLLGGFELIERTAKLGQIENADAAIEDIELLSSVFCSSICQILEKRIFVA